MGFGFLREKKKNVAALVKMSGYRKCWLEERNREKERHTHKDRAGITSTVATKNNIKKGGGIIIINHWPSQPWICSCHDHAPIKKKVIFVYNEPNCKVMSLS